MRASADEPRGITAILGPTNTGKTHHALERMLEHRSGMIGLPLRLLAREVYDRITTQIGESEVALITGEEKRVPRRPRYFVCTVEAMPVSQAVDFLAVDEIQLCAHPQRGHVFTDRLLNARGQLETWFLGSATVRTMLRQFLPTARVESRPRFSNLRGTETRSLSKLPPRSAVVAFSAERVYELATQLKNKRGGTAIVLGALSPRTRNAQVSMYQSGEVDYMVATDAIGMGLNLDIDHVAFADFKKFDGQLERPLTTAEFAQIAGRAGRYLNSGTFGTLAPLPEFHRNIIQAIESHQFPSEVQLVWRNSHLDFTSVLTLLRSLREAPRYRGLRLLDSADDSTALAALANRDPVRQRLTHPDRVELLWEVCQIPDFRQLWFELHVNLLEQLFLQLSSSAERIEQSFIEERLRAIDDTRGDIETLMGRIADIRTWTYVASHRTWVTRDDELKVRTAAIEDRLSDALHEKLVFQFVERAKTTASISGNRNAMRADRRVSPFSVLLEQITTPEHGSPQQRLRDWAELVINSTHEQLQIDHKGRIAFGGSTVAQFEAGPDFLHPEIRMLNIGELGPGVRSRVQRRLQAFVRDLTQGLFASLRVSAASELSPAARGLIYQLERNLGNILVNDAREQILALSERDRQLLNSFGVSIGRRLVYSRKFLGAAAIATRVSLVAARYSLPPELMRDLPASVALLAVECETAPWWSYLGFHFAKPLAIRVNLYESICRQFDHYATQRTFALPVQIRDRLACSTEQFEQLLRTLGFRYASGRWSARNSMPLNRARRQSE